MKRLHRGLWLSVCCSFFSSALIVPAMGRETTVIGTATVGYDYRERSYDVEEIILDDGERVPLRTDEDEGDVQDALISPAVEIVSRGLYDTLRFSYAPTLRYDFIGDETELDHALSLSAERSLSRIWSVTLANDFVLSNDPRRSAEISDAEEPSDEVVPEPPDLGDELSRDLSGRRYWTNTASAQTTYTPAENSRVTGGYTYTVLRNDSGGEGFDEYDRHAFFTDFSHGFNRNWRSSLGLNYTLGLYDEEGDEVIVAGDPTDPEAPVEAVPAESADLQEFGARLGIDYIQSVRDFFPLVYTFSGTQYEDTRSNIQTHEWSLGWDHAFDPTTRFAVGGGPSYAKVQGLDGDWGYNGYLSFTKRYEYLSFSLLADKQYETRNFTGTDASGVEDTYNVRATMAYRFSEALSLDLFGRYTWRSNLEPQGEYLTAAISEEEGAEAEEATGDITYDTDIYEIGTGLSYTFARWYTAGLRYTYYVSDGDLAGDQYNDHMVLVTLAASTELWRW